MQTFLKKQRGKAMLLIIVVVAAAVIFLLYKKSEESAELEILPEEIAEEALREYLRAAWDTIKMQGEAQGRRVKNRVLVEDWQWYEDNIDNILQDRHKLTESVGGVARGAVKMTLALQKILEEGAYRPDCEILSQEVIGNTEVVFKLKQLVQGELYEQFEVHVVRVGYKDWRVKDFAGGRKPIEEYEPIFPLPDAPARPE
jgi:hypothetical protein